MRWSVLVLLLLYVGCSPDLSDDPIPFSAFADITINLTLPEYSTLSTNGGYKNINGGTRGIIIYRVNSSTYYAFERNCSYQPNQACATTDVHASGLYMADSCCGSTFDFQGNPTGGPAWRPLGRYQTLLSGSTLTITDTVIQ